MIGRCGRQVDAVGVVPLALLAATCMAAERNQWGDELRARTLAVLFDGMRPHH
ncbi:hypothetical protein SAMN05660976_01790 [Nonomuraea pusilla]|uniref:Uncharacterized protein n=1 Tax=Nonomuraea pusilla TaxID=46177 RepID=A0A1H7M757_9ACTN|nr:hypothetical protein SAMN05660976_01790 [Nonomuraea pusilla]